jgi:cyclase
MKRILLLTLFALSIACAFAQQNYDTVKIRPVKITDNIYMLKGAGGNIGVLVGKDGTLMIDNQFGPLSNKINGAIKTINPAEIKFLINTHIHGDHSGGNENFKRMGTTIVAHDAVRERMSKTQEIKSRNMTFPPREKDALPVITFSDKLNFHLNEEDIEIVHLGLGHTDGDVIVHFKNANVFHLGDAFVRYGYPFIDGSSGGSFTGFLSTLDKAMAMMDDNSKVIPGHGELAKKADIKILRDKLVDIRDQVAVALKKGKKPEEIPAMGITAKYDAELGKGFMKGNDFVLMAAEEMKGMVKK